MVLRWRRLMVILVVIQVVIRLILRLLLLLLHAVVMVMIVGATQVDGRRLIGAFHVRLVENAQSQKLSNF